ncbi:MAG: mechanosensitive ion channel family protein [Acidimicrobiales bacterium]|nr:mechanosensitive ion channel family protein [Acidimicrobiales bacterium]MYD83035.1 mechanosensitive ion channel family protein [Acidimicrobiales bacterium]MYJ64725.1 mechanosensitive ion channel family protein [Acidimicrobiales bacterium]
MTGLLAQAESATDAVNALPEVSRVNEVCGPEPSWVCERIYEWTGSEGFASASVWIVDKPLTVLIILLLAVIARRVVRRAIDHMVERIASDKKHAEEDEAARTAEEGRTWDPERLADKMKQLRERTERASQRAKTLGTLFKSIATTIIWAVALMMLLGEFDVNLGPLIAGAGIIGVAVGFGAQSIVRDLLTGVFMLIEDQYGVGDVVDLGDAVGTVESVGLRTTRLRDISGTVWHVPNGAIARVGNMSQLWARVPLDLDVAYDTDLDAAMAIIKRVADEVWHEQGESTTVLEEPTISGVQAFGADAVTIRVMLKTEPSEQWATARLMRKRIKAAFDEAGIEIPFPQRTVWVRSGEPDGENSERSVRPFELMPPPLEGEGADADSADVDH